MSRSVTLGGVDGTPQPPRRRLTGAQRRTSILTAAATVFGERGYEHVRADDVAAAAGVSKALIYEHFRSKETIYLELLDRAVRDLLGRVVAASHSGSGVGRFEPAARAALEWVHEDPHAFQLLVRTVSDPVIARRQNELGRNAVGALAELMEHEPPERRAGMERPQLEQLARMIVGGLYGLGQWMVERGAWDVEEALSTLMGFMWIGLGGLQDGRRWPPDGDGARGIAVKAAETDGR
jgi:AcrR family transcriptional regulator